jgi:alkylation response protein AidB-like acyl-CoA dehydrogenase
MSGYAPFALTERLEAALGDASDPQNPFSVYQCVRLDERAEFPAEICRLLDEVGLPRFYVHARDGGELRSYEELLQIIRLLSRRDLTVAIAHGKTYLGAVSTWLAGDPELRGQLATRVLAGDAVSFALTERDHGSDLLASDVTAHRDGDSDGDSYRLTGEKWLINNATRASVICVLARTDPAGGPRGLSLLLVDKRRLPPDRFRCLPREQTHGVRGADISGIEFFDAEVPASALVGQPGHGLEIALKAFQITRTLCAGMSLGLLDHALRIAVRFAMEHRMYGRRLIELPHAGRTLAEAYADLLTIEATGLLATRSIHTLTGELSVTSAVVKYLVPTTTDRAINELSKVLGARALLTERYADGAFQKVDRDHRIVGMFDGNTLVNLTSLVNQFPVMARAYRAGRVDETGLTIAATLAEPPREFDAELLALVARDGSSVVQGVPAAVQEIAALAALGEAPAALAAQAKELLDLVEEVHAQLAEYRPSARDVPTGVLRLGRRYAHCFAAGAVLRFWLANRDSQVDGPNAVLWADAAWARAAMARLLHQLRPAEDSDDDSDDDVLDRLIEPLCAQYEGDLLFSVLTCRLPGAGS